MNEFKIKNGYLSEGNSQVTGSLNVSGGITGSLFGTSSYAVTASYATNAANGGVTQLAAGSGIILSPAGGTGVVTVSSTGGSLYNTATGSYGSFYDTGSVLAASATAVYSMSLSTTDVSNGVFVSASNGDVTRVKFTNAGVYNLQFSSQFSNTDNSNQDVVIWVRKNGSDITDSSGVATVPPFKAGSNGQVIAAWNYYLSLSAGDFIQMCWHVEQANIITLETIAAGTSPTHPRTPSTILTATRVDTFLSNTGSFSGSFTGTLTGTASYATNALSASYAPPAFPYTGSATILGSLVVNQTATTQSLNTSTRTLTDSSSRSSVLWNARELWDADPTSVLGYNTASLDWNNRIAKDYNSKPSIDWGNKVLLDNNQANALNWKFRILYTPDSTTALNWADDTYLDSNVYQRDFKSSTIQNTTSNTYNNVYASYLGDVIEVDGVTIFIDNTVTEGMLVYLNTNATWYPVDQASTVSTKLLGIAHNVGGGGANTGWILLEGHVVIDDTSPSGPNVQSPDHGLPIYIRNNTTTGLMSTVVPTATGGPNIVRVLGHCYQQNSGTTSQWMMKFRPSNDWVEI
jgi:hypothetical protein